MPTAEGVYKMYPHELSGGMRQRVMIAMALACNPKVIIADEPTTALDVTIQAQILDLLRNLKDKINSSIMLITHDLGVIAEMADYVVVMYAGRVVEKGTAEEIFANPCSSLHHRPDGLQTCGGQAGGQAVLHPRQGAQPHQHAQLLLFQGSLRNVRGAAARARIPTRSGCLPPIRSAAIATMTRKREGKRNVTQQRDCRRRGPRQQSQDRKLQQESRQAERVTKGARMRPRRISLLKPPTALPPWSMTLSIF